MRHLAEELNDQTRAVMTRVLTERRARAAAAAALRETAEETGLILGKPAQDACNFKPPGRRLKRRARRRTPRRWR
jgi:8-oxo-dGTP pyrophosphatase MutT (NUDIX family)